MPIAAVPQGVELRKISATQKKAIDDLLKNQKETSLLNSAIPATALLVVAGGAGVIFLFKDQIREWAESQVGSLGDALKEKAKGFIDSTGEVMANIVTDIVGRDNPRTPAEFTNAQGEVLIIPRCQRWETDYLDTQVQAQAGGDPAVLGLAQLNIIKNMKAEKCERPVIIKQSQWDKV